MKRVTLGFVALVAAGSLGVLGCGGGGPPPKTQEEAIDTRSSPAGKSVNPNTETNSESGSASSSTTDTSAGSANSSGTSGAGANNAADPSAGLTAATPPPAGKTGKTGKTGAPAAAPAGKTGPIISAADCAKLTDKYIELVISGEGAPLRGTTGKELEQAKEMVKASAASDPNFVNMQKACVKEIHRGQYTCGMNARSATEWQDCIR